MEIETNDNDFAEKVLEQSKKIPVIVDFWASWCGPCMALKPTMEKLAKEYDKKFILAKMNVEDNSVYARKYSIMSIPAVKFFKNGEVIDEFIGLQPENTIKSWIEKNL